ncbi:hypothetical protein [Jiulongibacter sp. NS-SX5]|uniref:hypothetical protein n=1 Tax=Jiulongibacter sp. NS-SX5 TaxID=3463854 RepID=UPI00405927F9
MKNLLLLFTFISGYHFAMSQNYDVMRDIVEQNPEYKIEEYFEIKNNEDGKPELVKVEKSILNGSQKITRIYYQGTPYYLDQQWVKATVKLPNQIPLDGYLSYNQVFHRTYFKLNNTFGAGTLVQPEYFTVDSTTFLAYPDIDILTYGFFAPTEFEKQGYKLIERLDKFQDNDVSNQLQGYVVDKKKYVASFIPKPVYFLIKGNKALKVEKNGYFIKHFSTDKKAVKQFLKQENIDFHHKEDVIKYLNFLM